MCVKDSERRWACQFLASDFKTPLPTLRKILSNAKLNNVEIVCRNLHRPQKSQSLQGLLLQNQRVKRLEKNRRGLRVKQSFSFHSNELDHTVDIIRTNITFQKEGERLCKIETERHAQSDVKGTLCTGNEEENLPTPRKFWWIIYLAVNYLSSGTLTNQILRCWADGGFETLKATLIQDSLWSFVFVLNLCIVQTRDLIGWTHSSCSKRPLSRLVLVSL